MNKILNTEYNNIEDAEQQQQQEQSELRFQQEIQEEDLKILHSDFIGRKWSIASNDITIFQHIASGPTTTQIPIIR